MLLFARPVPKITSFHLKVIGALQQNYIAKVLFPLLRPHLMHTFASGGSGVGVRWGPTNPLRPGVVVENARTTWLYQSSSVRDIFRDCTAVVHNLTWQHEHIES